MSEKKVKEYFTKIYQFGRAYRKHFNGSGSAPKHAGLCSEGYIIFISGQVSMNCERTVSFKYGNVPLAPRGRKRLERWPGVPDIANRIVSYKFYYLFFLVLLHI